MRKGDNIIDITNNLLRVWMCGGERKIEREGGREMV